MLSVDMHFLQRMEGSFRPWRSRKLNLRRFPHRQQPARVVLGFYKAPASVSAGERNIREIVFQSRLPLCSPAPTHHPIRFGKQGGRFYVLAMIFEQMGSRQEGGSYCGPW